MGVHVRPIQPCHRPVSSAKMMARHPARANSIRPGPTASMDDAAFKKLFSHPRMVTLLIRRHVPEWADRIDYPTLQPLPTELIDEQLRRRYPDMTWRVRTSDGSTDLVLLLEFQGRPERHMALRTTIYSCLAAQSLIQHDKELRQGDRELAVVALVLHHGDRRWNAATRLSDLFRGLRSRRLSGRGPDATRRASNGSRGPATGRSGAFRSDHGRADAGGAHDPATTGRGLRRRESRPVRGPGR